MMPSRTHTDTQTHRHTDTQTHRHTDNTQPTHRHTDTQAHRHRHRQRRRERRTQSLPPSLPFLFLSLCYTDALPASMSLLFMAAHLYCLLFTPRIFVSNGATSAASSRGKLQSSNRWIERCPHRCPQPHTRMPGYEPLPRMHHGPWLCSVWDEKGDGGAVLQRVHGGQGDPNASLQRLQKVRQADGPPLSLCQ
jgi:hypothetical protein